MLLRPDVVGHNATEFAGFGKLRKDPQRSADRSMNTLHGVAYSWQPETADATICPPYQTNAAPAAKGHIRPNLTFLPCATNRLPSPIFERSFLDHVAEMARN